MSAIRNETGTAWVARSLKRRSVSAAARDVLGDIPDVSTDTGSPIGPLVELQGEPGSGKTLYLTHFVATCVLPHEFKGADLGGLECCVLYVDADSHFSLETFASVLVKRVERCFAGVARKPFTAKELEMLVVGCMTRLCLRRDVWSPDDAKSLASKLKDWIFCHPHVSCIVW
jgi:RecA/RadA recombinase